MKTLVLICATITVLTLLFGLVCLFYDIGRLVHRTWVRQTLKENILDIVRWVVIIAALVTVTAISLGVKP